jgi:putative oxidoreductase
MNFRNKYAVVTVRSILGLFIIFSGVAGLLAGASMHGVPVEMVPTQTVLWQTGIFQMIKITEIIAGLLLLTGLLPALGAIALVPICVGVIVFNANVAPMYVITGVIISLFVAYMGYAYWDKYKALFTR